MIKEIRDGLVGVLAAASIGMVGCDNGLPQLANAPFELQGMRITGIKLDPETRGEIISISMRHGAPYWVIVNNCDACCAERYGTVTLKR